MSIKQNTLTTHLYTYVTIRLSCVFTFLPSIIKPISPIINCFSLFPFVIMQFLLNSKIWAVYSFHDCTCNFEECPSYIVKIDIWLWSTLIYRGIIGWKIFHYRFGVVVGEIIASLSIDGNVLSLIYYHWLYR